MPDVTPDDVPSPDYVAPDMSLHFTPGPVHDLVDHYIPAGVDRVEPGAAVTWQGRRVGKVVRVDDDGTVELSIGPGTHGLFDDPGAAYSIGDVREARPLCPECAQGKPDNCATMALDPTTDDLVPCRNSPILYGNGNGTSDG